MSERHFIPITPLARRERPHGAFMLGHERYRGFFAEPHDHDDLQVTVPLAGRMHLKVGGESHLIGPEGVIVLPARVPHAVTYLDGELDFLLVTAPSDWLAAEALRQGGRPPDPARAWVVVEPFLWPLARLLASEVDRPGPASETVLDAGLQMLAVLLCRSLAVSAAPATPGQDPRILRAIDRVLRDYADDLTVEELAREATMTARHFERCFKQAVGVPPRRYLIAVRLTVAKDLLETTDLSVTHVALDVGFPYPSHFIDTFRRAVGQTPQAYRLARRAKRSI